MNPSLNDWLSYLENRPQQAIQLGLERIRAVANRLQLLPVQAPVITVAGTNGKGSTVAALEAIYTEAGYRVGAYTSPHLLCFNERIRLNKIPASDEVICHAFRLIDEARADIHLTYFEMATLAALLYFKNSDAEVIVLEVGLGGRLDATNIVDATIGVITTIDFDHMDLLGHTLEDIGYEKAGIIKPRQRALIYADQPMPHSIKKRADELNVKTFCLGHEYDFTMNNLQLEMDFTKAFPEEDSLILPAPHIHPNAAAASIMVVYGLHDQLPVARDTLQTAVAQVQIAGRVQIIYDTICTVLDVSHNPQSVKLLANRMASLLQKQPKGRVHAVFSGLKDKALVGLIEPLCPWVNEWYTAVLDNPRAASSSMIENAFAAACGTAPHLYETIVGAFEAARNNALPGDTLIVYGSFYVVSPIMGALNAVVSR